MAARCGLICKLSSLVVRDYLKLRLFRWPGAHFLRSLWSGFRLRSCHVEAARGVWAAGRRPGRTLSLGCWSLCFLGLPQPGSLCGGCERSVTLGAVQKHGVVQLSTPVPGRLFLSRPCFLRACPPLRLALASEPTGWGAGDPPRAWKDTRVDGPLHCFPSTSSPRSLGDEGTHDSPEQRCREGRTGVRRGQLRARVRAGCVVTAVGVQ